MGDILKSIMANVISDNIICAIVQFGALETTTFSQYMPSEDKSIGDAQSKQHKGIFLRLSIFVTLEEPIGNYFGQIMPWSTCCQMTMFLI